MSINIRTMGAALAQDMTKTVLECEAAYHRQVDEAARAILARREKSPVVLLSGPSGSSKTTTGTRLREKIAALGVPAHLISMDNYYVDWNEPDFPRLPNGERDLESPMCLNIPLLNEHFSLLEEGVDIQVPIYDFPTHKPLEDQFIPMSPSHGDVFIFEGIHALNPLFTEQHPEAFRLYVSPEEVFCLNGEVLCDPELLRFMRRVVRDRQYRGALAEFTLSLWDNVVNSEKIYIAPYKKTAHAVVNTTIGYEPWAMKPFVSALFSGLGQNVSCRELVDRVLVLMEQITDVPLEMVPADSIVREFIG